jgi:hypothetical protein
VKQAIAIVDRMVEGYIKKNQETQTYTDAHDNALRQVLYDLMDRVMTLEASLAPALSPTIKH